MRRGIVRSAVLAWIAGWCCAPLHGAAWTRESGHGQVIVSFSFPDTSHWFDPSGKLHAFGDGGSFRQFDINPYLEYGLNSKTTLTLSTFVPFMRFANDFGSSSSGGLGDTEIGIFLSPLSVIAFRLIRRRFHSPDMAYLAMLAMGTLICRAQWPQGALSLEDLFFIAAGGAAALLAATAAQAAVRQAPFTPAETPGWPPSAGP